MRTLYYLAIIVTIAAMLVETLAGDWAGLLDSSLMLMVVVVLCNPVKRLKL